MVSVEEAQHVLQQIGSSALPAGIAQSFVHAINTCYIKPAGAAAAPAAAMPAEETDAAKRDQQDPMPGEAARKFPRTDTADGAEAAAAAAAAAAEAAAVAGVKGGKGVGKSDTFDHPYDAGSG